MKNIITLVFLALICSSCTTTDECKELATIIDAHNKKMSTHPRAFNHLRESVFDAYTRAEEIECQEMLGFALEYKLWYLSSNCNYPRALDYIEQLDTRRFSYPKKKEMYLNLFSAMGSWSRVEEETAVDFLKLAEQAAASEYEKTNSFDSMFDMFMCKSLYTDKQTVQKELDSLYSASGDEKYLAVTSVLDSTGDLIPICFGPIRRVFD